MFRMPHTARSGLVSPERRSTYWVPTLRGVALRPASVVCTLAIALGPGRTSASRAAAISLEIDPSVRSAGMGGATSSVFWGDDPNYWANPALLGYHHGIRYEWSKTQLVPDLASDVFFKSNRMTMGAWGLGFGFNLHPYELDYGESVGTGGAHSFEDIDSWGIGLSLVEAGESLLELFGGERWLRRYVDISLGYFQKKVFVDLAPQSIIADTLSGHAAAQTRDFGFLVRATPWNSIDRPVPGSPLRYFGGLRADLSFAGSWLNADDEVLALGPQRVPIPRDARWGVGVRLASGFPAPWRASLDSRGAGWLAQVFAPLVSVGTSWENSTITVPSSGADDRVEYAKINSWGLEASFANVLTFRTGSIDDPTGQIVGSTSGWSLGLRLGDAVGFRYDWATVPQTAGLRDVERDGFMIFVDMFGLERLLKPPESTSP